MYESQQMSKKTLGIVKAICGSLILGVPAIAFSATAQTLSSKVNPCPGIYYQEPFNRVSIVPQGCPPNAATQRRQSGVVEGRTTPGALTDRVAPATSRTGVIQPPLPEERAPVVANVMPMNGMVSVKLKNNTNAIVSYEAVGHTQRRFLPGGEEVVLQNLPTPVTITMVRQDEGLLEVMPVSASEQGLLEVGLDEETTLDSNQGVLRIQRDGQVFLN
ncbi:MAG: hypothetical protein KME06_04205 [Kastovskya adunca ATA6-11-RM4]|nr:hypothetical protein [Kastovskya adunca ATA6-11-RM4]